MVRQMSQFYMQTSIKKKLFPTNHGKVSHLRREGSDVTSSVWFSKKRVLGTNYRPRFARAEITKNRMSSKGYLKWPLVVPPGLGKKLKDVWKTELLSLRGFELRIFFHVTQFR
jgi:hypothetical protein